MFTWHVYGISGRECTTQYATEPHTQHITEKNKFSQNDIVH